MKSLVKRLKKYKLLYLVLLVAMAYYFVMLYIPIFWGFELSFKEMKIGSTISGAPWVGLQNYKYVFSNPEIFKLLKNTLLISVCRLVFTTIPPILLTIAIFDLKNKAYQKFCQTMVYIPHFFSWVIIYGIVYAFFSGNGLVNGIIRMFGGQPENFLTSSKAFVPLLIGSQLWKEVGWNTILYFAALTSVDTQLYEAAKIDGANSRQLLRFIKIPMIRSSITICVFMAISRAFMSFDVNLTLTAGGPFKSTELLALKIYQTAFSNFDYGKGQAEALVLFVIVAIISLVQVSVSKKGEVQA